jgi:hypothetical protein
MEAILNDIYVKGFNNGYFLAKYNAPLIVKLIQTETNLEYIQALRDGKKTFEMERKKERINEIGKNRGNQKNIER